MALIYRSILEIEDSDGTFVERARGHVCDWLRYKVKDADLDPFDADGDLLSSHGIELESQLGEGDNCSVIRISAYEGARADGVEVKTTLTAIRDEGSSWAWVDLERWTTDPAASAWIPAPPGLVVTLLLAESARCGNLALGRKPIMVDGDEGALVVDLVLDADRSIPIVVVSYNEREANGVSLAQQRGWELAKRLAGVATVYVLVEGAVTAFSRRITEAVGERMDVSGGAVRTYLPGAGSANDFPARHRYIAYRKLESRPPTLASVIVAPPLLRRAVETPPPAIWRSAARALLLEAAPEPEYGELLQIADDDIAELRRLEAELREQLDEERADNTQLQRRNDDLARRLDYFRRQLIAVEPAAAAGEPGRADFEPVLCSEVLDEARRMLPMIEIPEGVDEAAKALDAHGDESWAGRAWSAFQALNAYAEAKQAGTIEGSFWTYCDKSLGDFVIQASWVVPTESAKTMANPRFRELRTLPISPIIDPSGRTLMQEHVRIERGGTPSPRIYYYDDTRGATKKIHIGWFGDHLDSWAKS